MNRLLMTLIVCCCFISLPAASVFDDVEPDGEEEGFDAPDLEPGAADGKAKPAAKPAPQRVKRTAFSLVKGYADETGLKILSHGTGPVRLHVIGGATAPDPDALVKVAELSLKTLDGWIGGQGWFYTPKSAAAELFNICIIPDTEFNPFVDYTRRNGVGKPTGEDLVKKVRTYNLPRCSVLPSQKFNAHAMMPPHWMINLAASQAIRSWFGPQPGDPEPWLSEGIKAELERILTKDGTPRITTIAYEHSKPSTAGTGSWARDVADLIKKKDPSIMRGSMVMNLDLIGMSGSHYKQMWSWCQFVRGVCGKRKGEKNKFGQIMQIMADGQTGMKAIETVLKKDDKKMTKAWLGWAVRQK